ncbi:TetR/AcrR family transcriptional regulator [Frankia sp. Cas3]|uniref:TetR/AcrR family transcriptional regulator n=1 Tax=Frankia sp. Cas3 TaxID=3073926 RepID=UPI002AD22B44|nr:TetR/AcrR family transcriptional regulator [Frankia sp. Cas3]
MTRPPSGGGQRRESPRRARGSLSETEILDAAQLLVERDGLESLSMPLLARQLGAGVTSIYWYFRSKADLLEALVDRLAGDFFDRLPEVGAGPWVAEVERYYTCYRQELRRAPAYLELLAYDPGMVTARWEAAGVRRGRLALELEAFTGGGAASQRAEGLRAACLNYTLGFVIVEHGLRREAAEVDPALREETPVSFAQLDPDDYPVLHSLPKPEAIVSLDDEQFGLGLRLLLRGAVATVVESMGGQAD